MDFRSKTRLDKGMVISTLDTNNSSVNNIKLRKITLHVLICQNNKWASDFSVRKKKFVNDEQHLINMTSESHVE